MLKSAVIEEKTFKHSPWAGADNPLGPKFWCQQVGLITMVICCKFTKNPFQPLTLYTSFHDLINVYSRRSGADNPRGQNFDVNRNLLSLQSLATSFKKSLWSPRGRNFYVNRNILTLWSFVASFKKNLFEVWFYAFFFFMIFYMYIAPGQGQTAPRGQSFNVNRNVLSFHSFDASFKKMPLKSDFIQFVLWFNTCI